MFNLLLLLPKFFATLFYDQQSLVLENLALRQQLSVLQRSVKRPQFTNSDRCFWILLSRFWSLWRSVNTLMQANTIIRWHQRGFRYYWRLKSQCSKPGRPKIDRELRQLIRDLHVDNRERKGAD